MGYIPSPCYDVIDERLVFCDFPIEGFAANLSLQYVNSMNCMVIPVLGAYGGGWLYGCPMTHNISGLYLALQWHL